MNKIIGIVLTLVIVLGFLVPQLFLSKSFAMDRGTVIAAPMEKIHAIVADFTTWKDWTVWNKEADATLQYTYTGDADTVGHSMTWMAEELGDGKLTLTSIEPDRIAYDMEFDGQEPTQGAMVLEPVIGEEGRTAVRWEFKGEMDGMPYKRYFGLFMDKLIGPDFEKGLAGLKKLAESSQ